MPVNAPDPARPARRPRPARPAWKALVPLGFLALGLVAVVALIFDISNLRHGRRLGGQPDAGADIQAVLLGLTGPRLTDPLGFFTIVPPAGWAVRRHPACHPYNLVFRGPLGADISILVSEVDYSDFATLVREVERTQKKLGISVPIEPTRFIGRPAVRRVCHLHASRVLTLDFVEDGLAHHILCSAPPELFDKYEPVLMEVLDTYRPLARPPVTERARPK